MANLADWLPMPFWLGPPLPRFFNISWPWVQGEKTPLPKITDFIRTIEGRSPATAARTYNNIEETELIRDPQTGRIAKIIIHRKAEER